ncbi:S-layer homology domain-containing protein [Halalkalibacter oceani]|uniref:S-layer homology domain-containing protein n=1 Tax=Halalkalibacter oceani TaxID=1653776 RepID=UPI0033918A87
MQLKKLSLVVWLVLTLCLAAGDIAPAVQANPAEGGDYAGHWANETIEKWMNMNMLNGFPDGSIRPDQSVTRAEFIVLVNRAFGFSAGAAIPFHDVDENDWYAPAVASAVQGGYISGYRDESFRPLREVSRAEAAQMMKNILALDPDPAAAATFVDETAIAEWSRGAIGAVKANSIMSGYPDGQFQPERSLTRAEAIVLLDQALEVREDSDPEKEAEHVIIDEEGDTLGPEDGSLHWIAGDVTVTASNVTLQNVIIEGDLVIAKEVGEGDVNLHRVEVRSTMEVHGGGSESIHLNDSVVLRLVIDKENGAVRIVASGNTSVTETIVFSDVQMEVTDNADGEGFQNVMLNGSEMEMSIVRAVIDLLYVTEEVTDSTLYLLDDARIIDLINEGRIEMIEPGSGNQGGGTDRGSGGSGGGSGGPPISDGKDANYMKVAVSDPTASAGTPVDVTVEVYRSDDERDRDFNGDYTVTLSGYSFAPDGTAGFFAGEKLEGAATDAILRFTDGKASGELILHHAALQPIEVRIDGGAAIISDTMTVEPQYGMLAELHFNAPVASVVEETAFAVSVSVTDTFGNRIPESVSVTVEVSDAGTGPSELVGGTATVVTTDGVATFDHLILRGIGEGVRLRFQADTVELISDPITVDNLFETGEGTAETPFEVANFEQLTSIRKKLDAHFVLTDNIELPATDGGEIRCDDFADVEWCLSYKENGGWEPIGTDGNPFTGTFDGGDHTIANLTINRAEDNQGMFGHVQGGHIQNVVLDNAYVDTTTDDDPEGKMFVGLLVGKLDGNGSVTNATVSGEVSGRGIVGGLLGFLDGGSTVTDSSSDVTVFGYTDGSRSGGLIGENFGTVADSNATGNVTGGYNTGGLIGYNRDSATVIRTYATGDVEVPGINRDNGGLIGTNAGTVVLSFATGTISSGSNSGGLIGWNTGNVAHVYATGDVNATNFPAGLISGNPSSGNFAYGYATGNVNGDLEPAGLVSTESGVSVYSYHNGPDNAIGNLRTDTELMQRSTYEHWPFAGDDDLDGEPVWIINDGVGLPQLYWTYEAPGADEGLELTAITGSTESLNLNMTDNTTAAITLTGEWSDGTTDEDVTSLAMWHSRDSGIATVENGQVRAVSAGDTVIIAVLGDQVIKIDLTVE